MKGVSIARARYDFSARDRTELSLQEGDTIKILSKKGHNGWWKGEVYGRVCGLTYPVWGGGRASLNCAAPVHRWASSQLTMWTRTALNTADVAPIVKT